ncbi:TPA: hypothetical protein ACH3X3_011442 [Trebouxia sp. C0006]
MQSERSDGQYRSRMNSISTDKQRLQPAFRMKRRSALDRHAAFVRRLQRHRQAQEQSGQDHAVSKLIAADQLRSFTKRLRNAILSTADVAYVWTPAARVLDIKATLRNKLNNADSQAGHTSTAEKSQANAASSAPSNSVLQEMSQLVDAALSPAACEAVALPITTQDPCQTPHHDCDAAATHHDRSVRESGDGQSSIIKAAEYASVEDRGTGKGTLGPKGPHGLSSSQSTKSIGSKKVNRPAWALTADAAQDAEQKEEEDLLAFAGGLEFDEYINAQEDAELRTALQDIRSTQDPANIADKATLKRHVVRAINNLAGKDVKGKADGNAAIDAQSCAQQSEGAASTFFRATVASKAKDAGGRAALLAASDNAGRWDSSTKAGSDVGSMGNLDQDNCGELFRENPEMKKVHSLASAAALLKRVAATQPKQSCI